MSDPRSVLLRSFPGLRSAGELCGLAQMADDADACDLLQSLADLVTGLLGEESGQVRLLERCFGAVEDLATSESDGATDLVAYAFLDALPPEVLGKAEGWLGPCTSAILSDLEAGVLDGCDDI